MKTIRFERDHAVGKIVLANPPLNRLDLRYSDCLRQAVHEASESDIRVLLVKAEGPNFSLGGEVREWPGKDVNWFRTFVAEVNVSYRAIEALRVPTIAAVRGLAFGGGFELALNCDFIVAAQNAVFRCVEVTTGMLPIAGALRRLAERVGRARASRFAMLGEGLPGAEAGRLGIATHIVPGGSRGDRSNAGSGPCERSNEILRGHANAAEGLVGRRGSGGGRHGVGHHHGVVHHRGLHSRFCEYRQGFRSGD